MNIIFKLFFSFKIRFFFLVLLWIMTVIAPMTAKSGTTWSVFNATYDVTGILETIDDFKKIQHLCCAYCKKIILTQVLKDCLNEPTCISCSDFLSPYAMLYPTMYDLHNQGYDYITLDTQWIAEHLKNYIPTAALDFEEFSNKIKRIFTVQKKVPEKNIDWTLILNARAIQKLLVPFATVATKNEENDTTKDENGKEEFINDHNTQIVCQTCSVPQTVHITQIVIHAIKEHGVHAQKVLSTPQNTTLPSDETDHLQISILYYYIFLQKIINLKSQKDAIQALGQDTAFFYKKDVTALETSDALFDRLTKQCDLCGLPHDTPSTDDQPETIKIFKKDLLQIMQEYEALQPYIDPILISAHLNMYCTNHLVESLGTLQPNSTNGTLAWAIANANHFIQKAIKDKKNIISPMFSTTEGYRFCLRLYLNGDGKHAEKYVSIFLVNIPGSHNDSLTWPFRAQVQFTLIAPNDKKKTVSKVIYLKRSQTAKPIPHSSSVGFGLSDFVPIAALQDTFIKNDTLNLYIHVAILVPAALNDPDPLCQSLKTHLHLHK